MLIIRLDSCLCFLIRQIIRATSRKNQVIGSGNANYMVATAIHFKSPGIISLFLLQVVLAQCLEKIKLYRPLDGLLRIVALMASVNLLGVVFPCKPFSSISPVSVLIFSKNLLAFRLRPADCRRTSHRKPQCSF